MLKKHDEFTIAQNWVVALEYADFGGLESEEVEQIEEFINELPPGSTFEYSTEEPQFCKDEVSGLMADCVTVTVWVEK